MPCQGEPGFGYRGPSALATMPTPGVNSSSRWRWRSLLPSKDGRIKAAMLPCYCGAIMRAEERRAPLATERVERRLTAILAADVAGYSRLTGLDEEGTHAQLQDHLRLLVDPKIAEHRGRVVKNTGDGLLAEFSSVVDAVRCAVDVQRSMVERNADVPQERRIEFRIGINVGDVMIDAGARSRRNCRRNSISTSDSLSTKE